MTTIDSAVLPARILVVDDDDDTVTSTAWLLERCGVKVTTACDGTTALASAKEARFDLILLDIGISKLDGYAIAKALRQAQERVPLLVAMTGYGRPEDLLASAIAGFDLHLVKPVSP